MTDTIKQQFKRTATRRQNGSFSTIHSYYHVSFLEGPSKGFCPGWSEGNDFPLFCRPQVDPCWASTWGSCCVSVDKVDSRHQGSQQSSCPSPGAKHRPGLDSRGRGAARLSAYVLEVCSPRKRKQRPKGCKKGDSIAPVPPHGHLPSPAPRFAERYPTGCGPQRPRFCAPLPPPSYITLLSFP